jgi:hypothetical protein
MAIRRSLFRLLFVLLVACAAASGQFREIKAAPFSPAVARQKIRSELANLNAANRDQTVATISGWLNWFRDVLDDEMIARWKSDDRGNLPLAMTALGSARVARDVIDFSWRTAREATFRPAYAPMLGDLMERYPASAKPFLDDLLAPNAAPALTADEAQTVCRILLDMPDLGDWRKNALQILPHYRAAADLLLKQDLENPDQEKVYRARRWRSDLKLDPPPPALTSRRLSAPRLSDSSAPRERPHIVSSSGLSGSVGPQALAAANGYQGPMSGVYEWTGDPVPPNGECSFPNIPPVKLELDFDTKKWDAQLVGEAGAQVLVLRNKDKKTQKKCVVRWTVTGW